MKEFQLRDYQMDIYNKIRDEFKKGRKGVGVCLACRAGKTYVFGKIAQDANRKGNKVLILVLNHSFNGCFWLLKICSKEVS